MKNLIFAKPSLMVVYHLIALSGLIYVLTCGTWIHMTALFILHYIHVSWCSSATFHRYLAHSSWPAPRWFINMCSIISITGCYGSPLAWVSIHREHHKYADTNKDPHSPVTHSWAHVIFGVFYHKVNVKLVTDLLRDKFQVHIHTNYFKYLFGIPLLAFVLLDPLWAATITLAQGSLAYITAGAMLNIMSHTWGYRNYEVNDNSRNNLLLGYILYGEGWHNNHHGQPGAKFGGRRWWEIDMTYWLIKLLSGKKLSEQK